MRPKGGRSLRMVQPWKQKARGPREPRSFSPRVPGKFHRGGGICTNLKNSSISMGENVRKGVLSRGNAMSRDTGRNMLRKWYKSTLVITEREINRRGG